MELKELTERMHVFVRSKGWYEPESKRPQTPRNLAISLSLEANEVLEHFQWQGGGSGVKVEYTFNSHSSSLLWVLVWWIISVSAKFHNIFTHF